MTTPVQVVNNSGSSTSVSGTWSPAPVDGNLMVCSISVENDVSVTTPSGWTLINKEDGNTNGINVTFFKRASSEGTSISSTLGSSQDWIVDAVEYSGFSVLRDSDSNFGTGTSTSVTSISPPGDSLALSFASAYRDSISGPSSGFTEVSNTSNTQIFSYFERKDVSGAGSQTQGLTVNSSRPWAAQMLIFSNHMLEAEMLGSSLLTVAMTIKQVLGVQFVGSSTLQASLSTVMHSIRRRRIEE